MVNEIIDSINGLLVEKFPNTKVYMSKLEKDFTRPSFLFAILPAGRKI